jgi:hypothetical protein
VAEGLALVEGAGAGAAPALPIGFPYLGILLWTLSLALSVLPFIGYGRTQRLQGFVRDPRLAALGWFFLLYGIATLVQSGGVVVLWHGEGLQPTPFHFNETFNGTVNGTAGERAFHVRFTNSTGEMVRDHFAVAARPAWPFWLHHGLVLAALGVVAYAYLRPAVTAAAGALAAVPFFTVSNAVIQSAEMLLALVPTVVSVLNWRRRRTKGSLQVAVGFGLLALAHLASVAVVFVRPPALVPLFDVLALAGIATLVFAVPRAP